MSRDGEWETDQETLGARIPLRLSLPWTEEYCPR